jgi:hypothetical protein
MANGIAVIENDSYQGCRQRLSFFSRLRQSLILKIARDSLGSFQDPVAAHENETGGQLAASANTPDLDSTGLLNSHWGEKTAAMTISMARATSAHA